jgi:ATP synthase protein I
VTQKGEDEDRALRARLDKLSDDLQARRELSRPRAGAEGEGDNSGKFGSAMAMGLRVATEFAAAIVVGGLVGWQLDAWLGTKPLFVIAFFFLGVAAGVWNVIRATSALSGAKATAGKPPDAKRDED